MEGFNCYLNYFKYSLNRRKNSDQVYTYFYKLFKWKSTYLIVKNNFRINLMQEAFFLDYNYIAVFVIDLLKIFGNFKVQKNYV